MMMGTFEGAREFTYLESKITSEIISIMKSCNAQRTTKLQISETLRRINIRLSLINPQKCSTLLKGKFLEKYIPAEKNGDKIQS